MDAVESPVTSISAQVWRGGSDFEQLELAAPRLDPGQGLVAVDRATICGSDRSTVSGRRAGACPSILGHEAVGRLVQTHPEPVRDVRGEPVPVGSRIVWGVTAACGACDRCRRGLTAKCRQLLKTGHEPIDGPWPLSGGYASHVHLHHGVAGVRVPAAVDDGVAAVAACAGATVMACLAELDAELTGQRVLVNGSGMLGIFAAAAASRRGAQVVEVRDTSASRAALARHFGATHDVAVPVDGTAPESTVATFDAVIELSGAADGVRQGLAALDVGGCLVLAGSVAPAGEVAVDPERVVRQRHRITGVHNYEPRHLQQAIDFLTTEPALPWHLVIASPEPLSQLPKLVAEPESDPAILRRSVAPSPRWWE